MGTFFVGLFASLAGFFAQYVGRKAAIALAGVTAFVALTSAFYAAMYALLAGIYAALPANLAGYVGYCIPSNFPACVSVVVAAELMAAAYRAAWMKAMLMIG